MSNQWFFQTLGQEFGPVSLETLVEMARNGQLVRDDLVRTAESGSWIKAESVASLSPLSEPSKPRATLEAAARHATMPSIGGASADKEPSASVQPPIPNGTPNSPSPQEPPQADRWYVRIDGTNYGPVSYEKLEELLRPPRLCRTCEVRNGLLGDWVGISSGEELSDIAKSDEHLRVPTTNSAEHIPETRQPKSFASRVKARPQNGRVAKLRMLAHFLWDHRVIVALLTLWVSLNVGFISSHHLARSRDRHYLQTYTILWNEFKQLREQNATGEQWSEFVSRARALLNPILDDLEGSASRNRPIRRHLLWAGRDYLQPLLEGKEGPGAPTHSEQRLEDHLESARKLLAERG